MGSKFNIGDIVKCKFNDGLLSSYITKGKSYEVLEVNDDINFIKVNTDLDRVYLCNVDWFDYDTEANRNKVIYNILK